MDKLKTFWEFSKTNQRYFWVLGVFLLFLLTSYSFPSDKITSESCAEGNCQQMIKEPSLSDFNLKFFQNDVFSSQAGEFYRLTFREKANQNTIIAVKATDVFDQEKFLGEFSLPKSENDSFQEIVFPTDKKYTDFLFEKKSTDGAEVLLSDLRITKLNIKAEAEIKKIVPTIFGEINAKLIGPSQAQNKVFFKQLSEPKVILGQIFKAQEDYITEIEVDFNIVQQGTGNGGGYEFVFKKADLEDGFPEIKSDNLVSLKFSPAGAETYRQPNGKFKFPVYQKVDVGSDYFFGLNNDRADSNKFNYLELLGSSNSTSYSDGSVAIKKTGDTFLAPGDLYFNIFGLEWRTYSGQKILLGTTLEDLGGGKMLFKYQPSQKQYAMTDLNSFTSDISYDEKKQAITGTIDSENINSSFIYKFENALPFKTFHLSAQKNNLEWAKINLSYSLDGEKWQEIFENQNFEEGTQVFDQNITEAIRKNTIYLKVEPKINTETFLNKKNATYGLENLLIEAELQVKGLPY